MEGGTNFFQEYSKVNETFLRYRKIVIENKLPRRLELQHDVIRKPDGAFQYLSFDESFEGIIKSQLVHYRDSFEDVYYVWKENRDDFRLKQ